MLHRIRSYDSVLFSIVIVLSAVGLAAIYSIDLSHGEAVRFVPTQALACAIGLIVMCFGGILHPSVYAAMTRLFYATSIALLVAVLFFGTTIRGTTGWFRMGGLSFQPAEFAKFATVLALAQLIYRVGRRFDRPQFLIATAAIAFLPAGLIMLQPDLGSALVIVGVWAGFMALTVPKKRYLFGIAAAGALFLIAAWMVFFKPYQKERVLTFFSPERDPLGAGYNVSQSLIAIGAGRWLGRGLGFGSQSQLRFLPEAHTDFIFSVIAEELGLAGSLLTLLLSAGLSYRLLGIARAAPDDFGAYAVAGGALVFSLHLALNLGAATGLLPVTGVPLPFVSYGGSSYVANTLFIALGESVFRARRGQSVAIA